METKNLKKSKGLTALFLSMGLMITGCGQAGMETHGEEKSNKKFREIQIPASTVLSDALSEGLVSSEDAARVEEALMEELIDVKGECNGYLHLRLGDTSILVKSNKDVTDDPQDVAFTVNGIEVTNEMASDPETLQYLLASSSLLEPDNEGSEESSSHYMGMGQKLVRGDTKKKVVSDLLGLIIRSALGFVSLTSPTGALVSSVVAPFLLESEEGDQNSSHGESQNNDSPTSNPSSISHGQDTSKRLQDRVKQVMDRQPNGNPHGQTNQVNQSPGSSVKGAEQGASGKSKEATDKKAKEGFFKTVVKNIKEFGRDFVSWFKGLFKALKKKSKEESSEKGSRVKDKRTSETQSNK